MFDHFNLNHFVAHYKWHFTEQHSIYLLIRVHFGCSLTYSSLKCSPWSGTQLVGAVWADCNYIYTPLRVNLFRVGHSKSFPIVPPSGQRVRFAHEMPITQIPIKFIELMRTVLPRWWNCDDPIAFPLVQVKHFSLFPWNCFGEGFVWHFKKLY